MIDLILEIPMELKVIIGSGIIMGLLQYSRKDKVWESQQQKNQTVKKILKRDLVSNRKYKTTYKDIKKYFNIINKDRCLKIC